MKGDSVHRDRLMSPNPEIKLWKYLFFPQYEKRRVTPGEGGDESFSQALNKVTFS